MTIQLLTLGISFAFLWLGAGLAISSLEKVSHKLRASSFSMSFIILGFLTSISELSVGINSVLDRTPSLSVGNLIGASIVLLLLIIPLLAVLNDGVKIEFNNSERHLPAALLAIALPTFLVLDGVVSFLDSGILILAYVLIGFLIQKKTNILISIEESILHHKNNIYKDVIKIVLGAVIIFLSSVFIVHNAIYVSEVFKISPFLIGILFLSIGTNLPELSIMVYSTIKHKKQIALGDYIGSAAFNTFILGFIVLLHGSPILINGGLKINVLFLPVGATLLYLFTRKKSLSRLDGCILLFAYSTFVLTEVLL